MRYDVVIVGAGPAGLACAEKLAEHGRKVLILEKNKKIERKICTGLWGLVKGREDVKIPDFIFEKKFRKVVFHTNSQTREIKANRNIIATLNRKKLSVWMLKNGVKKGAEIQFNSEVKKIGKDYVLVNNKKIFFDKLVGADGGNSLVRRSLGLKSRVCMALQYWTKKKFKDIEIFFDPEKFGPWYAWIAPHKNLTSIGAGGNVKFKMRLVKKELNKLLKEKNIRKENFEAAPINWDYKGFDFGNKFLVGDAGGFASSWTGEGIYFAIVSGREVAKRILYEDYNCKDIRRILKVKKKNMMMIKILEKNKKLSYFIYNFLLFLCGFKPIARMILNFGDY